MKTKLVLLVASFLVLLGGYGCYKTLVGYVEVNGRVLNWYTKEPQKIAVSLITDNEEIVEENHRSRALKVVMTDDKGYFRIKSKCGTQGNYRLGLQNTSSRHIDIVENKSNDLGDVFVGGDFVYCRVNLIGRSDSLINFMSNNGICQIFKRTTTQMLVKNYFDRLPQGGQLEFVLVYSTNLYGMQTPNTQYRRTLPVNNLRDTLDATIFY